MSAAAEAVVSALVGISWGRRTLLGITLACGASGAVLAKPRHREVYHHEVHAHTEQQCQACASYKLVPEGHLGSISDINIAELGSWSSRGTTYIRDAEPSAQGEPCMQVTWGTLRQYGRRNWQQYLAPVTGYGEADSNARNMLLLSPEGVSLRQRGALFPIQ
jgi:hypothetical protein